MKRILWAILLLLSPFTVMAQSRFIACSKKGALDRLTADPTECGALFLSPNSDLVITVKNTNDYKVTRLNKKSEYYEYEVTVNPAMTKTPSFEIARRGDVNLVKQTVKLKDGILKAYLVEEVGTPIIIEPQNKGNEAVLDEHLAEVEIISSIEGLTVNIHPQLHATVVTKEKEGDASVKVTTIQFPVDKLRQRYDSLSHFQSELKRVSAKIAEKSSEELLDKEELLEDVINDLQHRLDTITVIDVYGPETNHLSIDVSTLGPRGKMRYGVMLLHTIVREHVSKCAGFLEEGRSLFELRNYDEARRAFCQALKAEDAPKELTPIILQDIADCDSCTLYTRYTKASLLRIKQLKDKNQVNQTDIAEYYSAAAEYLKTLNKYNPCEYYSKSIATLENFIKDMPFMLRFNVVHLTADRVSVGEKGAFSDVQIWAYTGKDLPNPRDYAKKRRFKKEFQKKHKGEFYLCGVTGADGTLDLEMRRSSLPRGFFFIPSKSKEVLRIFYKDAEDVMSQAKGTFMKRQFRVKLYHK